MIIGALNVIGSFNLSHKLLIIICQEQWSTVCWWNHAVVVTFWQSHQASRRLGLFKFRLPIPKWLL